MNAKRFLFNREALQMLFSCDAVAMLLPTQEYQPMLDRIKWAVSILSAVVAVVIMLSGIALLAFG